jgi:hypothetical protein
LDDVAEGQRSDGNTRIFTFIVQSNGSNKAHYIGDGILQLEKKQLSALRRMNCQEGYFTPVYLLCNVALLLVNQEQTVFLL